MIGPPSGPAFPNLGDPAKGLGIPRESDFEGQRNLITELPQDRGKQRLLEGTNKACAPRTQRKGAVAPPETENLPVSVWGSPAEAWVSSGLMRGQRHCSSSPGRHVLAQVLLEVTSGQTTNKDGAQLYPIAENWIKGLLSMALPTRARPSFPHGHSRSLPSQSLCKPLILIHQRADRRSKNYNPTAYRTKTTITESYPNDHMNQSLV